MDSQITPQISAEIKRAWQAFKDVTGLVPNILIVGPNGADEVASSVAMWGMRVVVNDFAPKDYSVGYAL